MPHTCDAVATPGSSPTHMNGTSRHGMMMDAEFDLAFVDMMIPHHEGAVAMAEVALERSEHEEIRSMARDIIASQDAEIEQFHAWRTEWYPDAPLVTMSGLTEMMGMGHIMPGMQALMGGMGAMHMDPAADRATLCSATGDFDRAFIDMMIPHHEGAIMMAEAALQHAQHPEITGIAREIIDAQHREIDQMRDWRAAWYGDAPAGTPAAPDATVVVVTLTEFSVTASLTEYHVGQPYKFVVSNAGALPHELMVMPRMTGIGQKSMEELHHDAVAVIPVEALAPRYYTQEVEVTFAEPGTYELVCALPGHYDSGMRRLIEVAA